MGFWQRISSVLFEQPPTVLFVEHGEKVVKALEPLLSALRAFGKGEDLESYRAEVDRWEHEADQVKHEIRRELPRSDLFLPMARGDLMDLLWQQDEIADKAQEAVHLLSLLPLKLPADLQGIWDSLTRAMEDCSREYGEVIAALGRHLKGEKHLAERIRRGLVRVGETEHEVGTQEAALVTAVYRHPDLDAFAKFHLVQVSRTLGQVAGHMENTVGRICLLFLR
ncbi:DUF47 family protein [Candidatus Bipolaricaulota bacterium]|nr:DUF47 family protein [Candidatus Bipolaricaulota bacterium]